MPSRKSGKIFFTITLSLKKSEDTLNIFLANTWKNISSVSSLCS